MNLYVDSVPKNAKISYFGKSVELKMVCRRKEDYTGKTYDVNLHFSIWDIPWFIRKLMPALFKAKKDILDLVKETHEATEETEE